MLPQCPHDRAEALGRSRGVYLVIRDEDTPPAERGRSVHQRLRTCTRCVEREPEPPQPAGGRPARSSSAIPHGQMLRKPSEQRVPALITYRSWRIFKQTQPDSGWFMVVFLEELDNQPPLRVKVPLACDKTSRTGKRQRLISHVHSVANSAPGASCGHSLS